MGLRLHARPMYLVHICLLIGTSDVSKQWKMSWLHSRRWLTFSYVALQQLSKVSLRCDSTHSVAWRITQLRKSTIFVCYSVNGMYSQACYGYHLEIFWKLESRDVFYSAGRCSFFIQPTATNYIRTLIFCDADW